MKIKNRLELVFRHKKLVESNGDSKIYKINESLITVIYKNEDYAVVNCRLKFRLSDNVLIWSSTGVNDPLISIYYQRDLDPSGDKFIYRVKNLINLIDTKYNL